MFPPFTAALQAADAIRSNNTSDAMVGEISPNSSKKLKKRIEDPSFNPIPKEVVVGASVNGYRRGSPKKYEKAKSLLKGKITYKRLK